MACVPGGRTRPEIRRRPSAGIGEVVLRTRVCGLCGTDLFKLAHDAVPAGTVLGHELVGEVVEIGGGVEGWRPGERVVVPHHVACGGCALCRRGADTQCEVFKRNQMDPGGFAELVRIGAPAVAHAMHRVPAGIADEVAAFLEPAACVLRGVDKAALPPAGGLAVVVGAGSMGLLHLLVLRALEPDRGVVLVDPVAARRRLAVELGAVAGAPPDEVAAVVAELSGGLGADAVFDTVGGAAVLRTSLAVLRPGGAVVLFAHAGDGEVADFELNRMFKSERRVLATYSAGLAEQRRTGELLFAGRLDPSPLVTHRLPLAELDRGVELVRARAALKVMLAPEAA